MSLLGRKHIHFMLSIEFFDSVSFAKSALGLICDILNYG